MKPLKALGQGRGERGSKKITEKNFPNSGNVGAGRVKSQGRSGPNIRNNAAKKGRCKRTTNRNSIGEGGSVLKGRKACKKVVKGDREMVKPGSQRRGGG